MGNKPAARRTWIALHHADPETKQKYPLLLAVFHRRIDEFTALLANPSIDVNATDPDGNSAAFACLQYGGDRYWKLLMECPRFNINQTNSQSVSLLACAFESQRDRWVRPMLLRDDLNVNVTSASGEPIWVAMGAFEKFLELDLFTSILQHKSFKPSLKSRNINSNSNGHTMATYFALRRLADAFKLLLKYHPVTVNDRCELGSVIEVLVAHGREDRLRFMMDDVLRIAECQTPPPFKFLESLQKAGVLEQFLQSRHATPEYFNRQDENGDTTLHLQARKGGDDAEQLLRALCAHAADINIKNKKGELASDYADTPSVRALFRRGHEESKKKEVMAVVQWTDVRMGAVVGSGVSAVVHRAAWQGTDVAVKVMRANAKKSEFEHEVRIAQLLGQHPRVVPFCGACPEDDHLLIVMNFLKFGSAEDYLLPDKMSRDKLPLAIGDHIAEQDSLYNLRMWVQILVDVSSGLLHLHSKNVIHCDVAARNCLVDSFQRAYISDFGMSQELAGGATVFVDTESSRAIPLRWCAPETITLRHSSRQSDVYMFAVLVTELIARQAPYQRCVTTEDELIMGVLDKENPLRPVIPQWCPAEISEILELSWVADPSQRLTMTQVNQRLTEYLEKCFRAKNIRDVYTPMRVAQSTDAELFLSLEDEMRISSAYQSAKRSHYMYDYQPVSDKDKPAGRHTHSATCHPLRFGSSVEDNDNALVTRAELKHVVEQLRQEHAMAMREFKSSLVAQLLSITSTVPALQGIADKLADHSDADSEL